MNAGCPPIRGDQFDRDAGDGYIDDERERATIRLGGGDDHVGQIGVGDEVRDTVHPPAVVLGPGS